MEETSSGPSGVSGRDVSGEGDGAVAGSSMTSGGGNRCVVAKCSNRARDGFSVYTMPDKPKSVRNKWVRFISNKRDFKASQYSKVCVCSGHFTIDQFNEIEVDMYKRGLRTNPQRLR